MKITTYGVLTTALLLLPALGGGDVKTYKHASSYQIAILDQNLRVATGTDVTLGKTTTDVKLGAGGQGIHLLHTVAGDYRVEAPINKGLSIISAMGSNAYHPAQTFHNKWFMDNVQPGTKVLFASRCSNPSKTHPNETVRCIFWFPDPDSTDHEYTTMGDFTPYTAGDGGNMQKTANTLCGTGKLRPEVEAELCPAAAPAVTPHDELPPQASTASVSAIKIPLPSGVTPFAVAQKMPPPPPVVQPQKQVVEEGMAVSGQNNEKTVDPQEVRSSGGTKPTVSGSSLTADGPVPSRGVNSDPSTTTASDRVMLTVTSKPAGADITINGKFVGNTPSTVQVDSGEQVISISKQGYHLWTRDMKITGGQPSVSAELHEEWIVFAK